VRALRQTGEWSEAIRHGESDERNRFLEHHLEFVRYLAQRTHKRLPHGVELEDLIHDGVVGLLDAVEKYDPGRGVKFRTYAETRVRGAILDGLRRRDWRTRSAREHQRVLTETVDRLESKHGRPATEDEIASELGLDNRRYRRLLEDANSGPLLSLDSLASELAPEQKGLQPHTVLERRELLLALAEELTRLPQRERRVLELYYSEELTMKEVGAVLGVTESRVCQLHTQAAVRLRAALLARLRCVSAGVPATERGTG
jgi:RNA polymerase sigma factor for flagellar operon FliA